MAELQYSKLLSAILKKAESLSENYGCKGVARDHIVVAAIELLAREDDGSCDRAEKERVLSLIRPYSTDRARLDSVLEKWRGKSPGMTEIIVVNRHKDNASKAAQKQGLSEVPADLLLGLLTKPETEGIASLREGTPPQEQHEDLFAHQETKETAPPAGKKEPDKEDAGAEPRESDGAVDISHVSRNSQDITSIIARTQHLQADLQKNVLGQSHAIRVFTAGYFNAELQAAIDKERKAPRGIFLFAGPPGVGKTFLAENAAESLGLESKRFDMSGYAGPTAAEDLCGYGKNYKNPKEGQLTGFVNKYPECVLIFDEIEKAHYDVILLFLQILDAGHLKDNCTEENVSFKHAILIFTTNVGKELYEDKQDENLSLLSRDVIIDALKKETHPVTREPLFPAAICSRFASGNVVMFNHLKAHTLTGICRKRLIRHMDNMKNGLKVQISMHRSIPSALLLAEGAQADARMVNSRVDTFFSTELYELYRLLPKKDGEDPYEKLKSIRFSIDLDHASEQIRNLFIPVDQPHVAVFSPKDLVSDSGDTENAPVVHRVKSFDECSELMNTEKIEMLICDVDGTPDPETAAFLNWEDVRTRERAFLHKVMKKMPSLPVVLYDDEADPFTMEEKDSYVTRGVRGFLSSRDLENGGPSMHEILEEIFQQNQLAELARSNQLLHFETAQKLSEDGTEAEIIVFDLSLEQAIKGEDAKNVMSLLSTPNVTFDEVIGAEEAKKELKFFIQYMNDPRKYRKTGAAAPKGVLLYGPPGTGKTMLAKAFAKECGAVFISTVGSQFFIGHVGDGPALVRRLFATARRYAPAVLFVDEIDAIARERSGRDTDMAQDAEQILTSFFAEMDGFSTDPTKPVFVLGATNYGMNERLSLDPAMLRRFDRQLLIDLPTPENREKFLRMQFEKKPMFDKVSESEIKSLTERSTGMSLANLASVLDLATRTALQNGKDKVTDADMEEAFETFNGGEKKNWSREVVLRTARHEAGHAVISWLAGDKPTYITIVSRGHYGGYMQHGGDQEERFGYTKKEMLNLITTALGGRAAEIVYYGTEDGITTGPSGDLRSATALAKRMICELGMDDEYGLAVTDTNALIPPEKVSERVNAILRAQLDEAIRLITENKERMDALIAKLLEKNHLNKEEIDEILK